MARLALQLLAGAAALLTSVAADATVYLNTRTIGTGSVNLSITTDNSTGTLTAANITAFNILVSNGTNSFTLTNANSTIDVMGTNLSATASSLSFNFGTDGYFLFQSPVAGSGGPLFCLQGGSSACFDFGGAGEGLAPITANSTQALRLRGNQVIASVGTTGAVPEPSTWAMMLLGFAGIGVALRRRRRASGAQFG